MSSFETSAGATAPATGERTLARHPQHAPAVEHLTLEQATRLRGRIDALQALAVELGVRAHIDVMGLDDTSAFDVFPESEFREFDHTSSPDETVRLRKHYATGGDITLFLVGGTKVAS
jgi:hypothetical protein